MPQYKYPVKGGAKWMTKFNYTDPKSGIVKTAYKRGFDSKREAKKYEDDFIDSLIAPEEDEVEVIRTYGDVFQEYLMSHKRADIKESSLETKFNIFNKHIFPTFEEVPIDSITDDDIANWQKKMKLCIQPNGKHFSEAYLRTIQSQFNSIINYAFSKGYLKANPLLQNLLTREASLTEAKTAYDLQETVEKFKTLIEFEKEEKEEFLKKYDSSILVSNLLTRRIKKCLNMEKSTFFAKDLEALDEFMELVGYKSIAVDDVLEEVRKYQKIQNKKRYTISLLSRLFNEDGTVRFIKKYDEVDELFRYDVVDVVDEYNVTVDDDDLPF